MAEREETRVRTAEPRQKTIYDLNQEWYSGIQWRAKQGQVVVRSRDREFEQSRQSLAKFYLNPNVFHDTALEDWIVFVHDVRIHSGKHVHQGGLVIYVLEGEGYTVVDGQRIDWEAGDLILLPMKQGGVEHQHFNRNPNRPCRWLAFINTHLQEWLATNREQKEDSPDYRPV